MDNKSQQQLKLKVLLENLTVQFETAPPFSSLPRVFLIVSQGDNSVTSKRVSLIESPKSPGSYTANLSSAVIPMTVSASKNGDTYMFSPSGVQFQLKGLTLGQREPEVLATYTFQLTNLKTENLSVSEAIERKKLPMTTRWGCSLSRSKSVSLQVMFQYQLKPCSPPLKGFQRLWKAPNRRKPEDLTPSRVVSSPALLVPKSSHPQEEGGSKLSVVYAQSMEYDGSIAYSEGSSHQEEQPANELSELLVDYSCSPPKVPPRSPIQKPESPKLERGTKAPLVDPNPVVVNEPNMSPPVEPQPVIEPEVEAGVPANSEPPTKLKIDLTMFDDTRPSAAEMKVATTSPKDPLPLSKKEKQPPTHRQGNSPTDPHHPGTISNGFHNPASPSSDSSTTPSPPKRPPRNKRPKPPTDMIHGSVTTAAVQSDSSNLFQKVLVPSSAPVARERKEWSAQPLTDRATTSSPAAEGDLTVALKEPLQNSASDEGAQSPVLSDSPDMSEDELPSVGFSNGAAIYKVQPSTNHNGVMEAPGSQQSESSSKRPKVQFSQQPYVNGEVEESSSTRETSPSTLPSTSESITSSMGSKNWGKTYIQTQDGAEFVSPEPMSEEQMASIRAQWRIPPAKKESNDKDLTTAIREEKKVTGKRPLTDFIKNGPVLLDQKVGILKVHIAAVSTGDRPSTHPQQEFADLFGLTKVSNGTQTPSEGAYCVFTTDGGNARIETTVKPIVPQRPTSWDKNEEELFFYTTPSKKVFIMCCKTKYSESERSTMTLISDISQKKPREESCFGAVVLPVSKVKQHQLAIPPGSADIDIVTTLNKNESEGISRRLEPKGSVLLQTSFLVIEPRFKVSCFGQMTIDSLVGMQCGVMDDVSCTVRIDSELLRCTSPLGLDCCGAETDGWRQEPFNFIARSSTDCNIQIWAYSLDEKVYWCGGCSVPLAMVLPDNIIEERKRGPNNATYVLREECTRTIVAPVEPVGTITLSFELKPNPEAIHELKMIEEEFSVESSKPPTVACNSVGTASPEREVLSQSGMLKSFRRRTNTRMNKRMNVGGFGLLLKASYKETSFRDDDDEQNDLLREVEYLKEELRQIKVKLGESEFFREKTMMELRAAQEELTLIKSSRSVSFKMRTKSKIKKLKPLKAK